ncbi:N-acetyltransferase [Paenibacillus sp. CAA11]|uniref:GNAT family N-acetyltransferase n=1 Tax=Paenibacillus sp. CAA11 TaxID=1532905 RepID=UPI000D38128A|nr:GNAT family N-acetyltransferase [Paenibacillus sp. CAA11]AWB43070.1 N-acetyltransferase [Paenibacillus sp. CAA11]
MRETIQEGNGFVMREDGEAVAEVTYIPQGDALVIDHTFVSEALRGQKVGEELIKRVVEHARESDMLVVPACAYAHALFKRHKEYGDVWKK